MSVTGKQFIAAFGLTFCVGLSSAIAQSRDHFGPPPAATPPASAPSNLRLASPLPYRPPAPTLQLGAPLTLGSQPMGSPPPITNAPVRPALPAPATYPQDAALSASGPQLTRQPAVFRAEPQPAGSEDESDPETKERSWKPGPVLTDAVQSGQETMKSAAQSARRTKDLVLGIERCPDCGKRRPDKNRYRVGIARARDFIRPGRNEEKVAMSPKAKPAS